MDIEDFESAVYEVLKKHLENEIPNDHTITKVEAFSGSFEEQLKGEAGFGINVYIEDTEGIMYLFKMKIREIVG